MDLNLTGNWDRGPGLVHPGAVVRLPLPRTLGMFGWFLFWLEVDTSRSFLCTLVAHTTFMVNSLVHRVMVHFFSVTYIPAFLGRRITVFHPPSLPLSTNVSMSLPLLSVQ